MLPRNGSQKKMAIYWRIEWKWENNFLVIRRPHCRMDRPTISVWDIWLTEPMINIRYIEWLHEPQTRIVTPSFKCKDSFMYPAGLHYFKDSDVQFWPKSIPNQFWLRNKALRFNSESISTLEYISSIWAQFNSDSNSKEFRFQFRFCQYSKHHTSTMSIPFHRIRILLWIQVL